MSSNCNRHASSTLHSPSAVLRTIFGVEWLVSYPKRSDVSGLPGETTLLYARGLSHGRALTALRFRYESRTSDLLVTPSHGSSEEGGPA